MLELFHIMTRFTIRDGVSRGLLTLSSRFTKTDKEAKRLQTRIDKIKTTMLAGAGLTFMGALGIRATAKMLKPAAEYLHTMTQAHAVGMKQVDIANLVAAAWRTTAKVQTVSVNEALRMGISLRRILGSVTRATTLLPEMARFKTAFIMAKEGGKLGTGADTSQMVYTAAKAAEMAGATGSKADFDKFMNNMIRVAVGTAGKVTPMMYMGLLKYARGAGMALDEKTLFRTAPILMEEMALGKGGAGGGARGGPGAVFNAWNRMLVQGVMTKSTLAGFQSLGLIKGAAPLSVGKMAKYKNLYKDLLKHPGMVGAATQKQLMGLPLVGGKMAAADPISWIFKYLEPALHKKYPTLGRKDLAAKAALYFKGNSLAAWLAANVIARPFAIHKEIKMLGGVPATAALMGLSRTDPNSAGGRIKAQWTDLMIALGKPMMKLLIPAGNALADVLGKLAQLFKKFPALGLGLVSAFGALSVAMAIGGTVLLLKGAFLGLNIALEALGVTMTVGAMAVGIGEIALALMALYEAVVHWKDIIAFLKTKPMDVTKGLSWAWHKPHAAILHGDKAAAANSSGIHIRPHTEHRAETHVLMDGKKVGKIVAQHIGSNMFKASQNQRSSFDIGLNLPGVNYGF